MTMTSTLRRVNLHRPRAPLACWVLSLGLLPWATWPTSAHAQTPAAPMSWPADPDTLQAFGQRAGLGRLATDFVDRLASDARTAEFFRQTARPELASKLADQFCVVLGGPCRYEGADMRVAHQDLDIRRQDFNALVEVLQASMAAQGVPFASQNRLLARLAPMHREIINTP
jgi:hemoglobin